MKEREENEVEDDPNREEACTDVVGLPELNEVAVDATEDALKQTGVDHGRRDEVGQLEAELTSRIDERRPFPAAGGDVGDVGGLRFALVGNVEVRLYPKAIRVEVKMWSKGKKQLSRVATPLVRTSTPTAPSIRSERGVRAFLYPSKDWQVSYLLLCKLGGAFLDFHSRLSLSAARTRRLTNKCRTPQLSKGVYSERRQQAELNGLDEKEKKSRLRSDSAELLPLPMLLHFLPFFFLGADSVLGVLAACFFAGVFLTSICTRSARIRGERLALGASRVLAISAKGQNED